MKKENGAFAAREISTSTRSRENISKAEDILMRPAGEAANRLNKMFTASGKF
jgi:hypothetical protein